MLSKMYQICHSKNAGGFGGFWRRFWRQILRGQNSQRIESGPESIQDVVGLHQTENNGKRLKL
jgi:hypothetical protein